MSNDIIEEVDESTEIEHTPVKKNHLSPEQFTLQINSKSPSPTSSESKKRSSKISIPSASSKSKRKTKKHSPKTTSPSLIDTTSHPDKIYNSATKRWLKNTPANRKRLGKMGGSKKNKTRKSTLKTKNT
jgi:hypothetical protein